MRRSSMLRAGCAAGILLITASSALGQTLKVRPPAGQDATRDKSEPERQDAPVPVVEAPLVLEGRAVRLHLCHRVLTYGNKTVVFD